MEKATLTIRLPVELKERLDELSKQKGLTLNAIIVEVLWKKVQEE